jgi:hypothetical protein
MFTWLNAVMPRVLRYTAIGVQYLVGDGLPPEGSTDIPLDGQGER